MFNHNNRTHDLTLSKQDNGHGYMAVEGREMPSERRLLGQEMKQESNRNPEGRDQQKRE